MIKHEHLIRRLFCHLAIVCSLFHFGAATGDCKDGRLSIDLAGSTPKIRSNSPVQLLLKVYWNGTSLVEGNLEITVRSGEEVKSQTLSHDMVLTTGEQLVRVTLPSTGGPTYTNDKIGLRFITKNHTFELPPLTLTSRPNSVNFNMGIVAPDWTSKLPDALDEQIADLHLRSISPNKNDRSLSFLTTRWENADLPEHPLLFCSFDLLVVTTNGFAELRKKQMVALQQWVRAGGSLCVFLSSNVESQHVEFLNQLLSQSYESPFLMDSQGRMRVVSDAEQWRSDCELGRVVVMAPPTESPDMASTKQTTAYLWKVERKFANTISGVNMSRRDRARNRPQTVNQLQYSQQQLRATGQLINRLMPDSVSVVPTSLIGLVLFGYLLLIGPGDYYFLGLIRKRKWTWVTFPLMTLAVTFLCMAISEWYLSSESTGQALVIQDMARDGTVVRESTLQMHFHGRQYQVTEELENALFTNLDQNQIGMGVNYRYQYQAGGVGTGPTDNPTFKGRIPTAYSVTQTVPQWMPWITREFKIAPAVSVNGFDWSEPVSQQATNDLHQRIRERWPNATAYLIHAGDTRRICGKPVFRDPNDGRYRNRYAGPSDNNVDAFLQTLCVRNLQVTSNRIVRLAPNGGYTLDDLGVIDMTDPNQTLLVIADQQGEKITLYRRLYTDNNND